MCKHDFDFYVPFLCLYILYTLFIFFSFLWSTRVFPFAPTYSSIAMRKSDLRSSFGTKCLVKLFFYLFARYILIEQKGHLRCWTIKRSFDFERGETLRRWTINDLLGWSTKAGLLLLRILNCDEEIRPT